MSILSEEEVTQKGRGSGLQVWFICDLLVSDLNFPPPQPSIICLPFVWGTVPPGFKSLWGFGPRRGLPGEGVVNTSLRIVLLKVVFLVWFKSTGS